MKQAGVYYREFDLTQIVTSDSNLPAGIVIVSKRGRSNEITTQTNTRSFVDEYGQPDARVSFAPYCALAYLEQGNLLRVNRVVGSGATYGCLLLRQEHSGAQPKLVPIVLKNPKTFDFFSDEYVDASGKQLTGGVNIGLFYPKGQGGYSEDMSISIVSTNIDPVPNETFTASPVTGGGILKADTYYYAVSAVNSEGETLSTDVKSATLITSNSSVSLKWEEVLGATGYRVYGRSRVSSSEPLRLLTIVNDNNFVDTGAFDELEDFQPKTASIQKTNLFNVSFYDKHVSDTKALQEFTVTLDDNIDGMGRQTRIEDVINPANANFSFLSNVKSLASIPEVKPIKRTVAAKGDSGAAVVDRDIINGWEPFADGEQVYVRLLINGGYASPSVQRKMIQVAEKREDCIAFLDVPSDKQSAQSAADYRRNALNANTSRAALFAQDLLIDDPYQGRQVYVPPSGHMAALAAKTAFNYAVWYPMAGLNRGQLNVLGIRHQYNEGEREILASSQVNYVRNFPGQGLCLFEQLTLQSKQSALSWINIRLMMDELRIAMTNFVWYSVHEINDDFLRRQVVAGLTEFLQTIQDRRGIKRFLVVADDRNNSEHSTMSGKLNIEVFISPQYATNQIYLNSILTKNSANFEELVGEFAA